MKKLFNAAFIYMVLGVASGLFYREFTKANAFPEGEYTVNAADPSAASDTTSAVTA